MLVDLNVADWETSKKRQIFSFVVLILLTFGQISSQWERGLLTPAFQQQSTDPRYSIKGIITNAQEFGKVSGLYFNVPLIMSSLAAGLLTERFSRRLLISIATIGLSACVVGMAFSFQYY